MSNSGWMKVEIHVPSTPEAIEAVAEGLVGLNCYLLDAAAKRGIRLPRLYESGIRYRRELPGHEWWESITDVVGIHGIGEGDCEDLAAIRAAELRYYDGEAARVRIGKTARGSFHAIVEHEDGTLEDPSRILVDQEHDEYVAAQTRRKGR